MCLPFLTSKLQFHFPSTQIQNCERITKFLVKSSNRLRWKNHNEILNLHLKFDICKENPFRNVSPLELRPMVLILDFYQSGSFQVDAVRSFVFAFKRACILEFSITILISTMLTLTYQSIPSIIIPGQIFKNCHILYP